MKPGGIQSRERMACRRQSSDTSASSEIFPWSYSFYSSNSHFQGRLEISKGLGILIFLFSFSKGANVISLVCIELAMGLGREIPAVLFASL
jgi:hypothetical protein